MKHLDKLMISFAISVAMSLSPCISLAQGVSTAKRSIATVLFASLGGAVLGLSTLSFYSDAQNHTSNITIGSLLGFVGGVTYVALEASEQQERYSFEPKVDLFEAQKKAMSVTSPPTFIVTFDF